VKQAYKLIQNILVKCYMSFCRVGSQSWTLWSKKYKAKSESCHYYVTRVYTKFISSINHNQKT